MPQIHVVRQGDHLAKIAHQYGFPDWRTIYDHALNAAFRRKRPNPNVLYPGDRLTIPDVELGEVERATDALHVFQIPARRTLLRIRLVAGGKVLAKMPYRLVAGSCTLPGSTDDKGFLKEWIPAHTETAELTLPKIGLTWSVQVGGLDPVHDHDDPDEAILTGVQARLNNLGYHAGPEDGIMGPKTRAALREFQQDVLQRKNPDGEPDRETRDALLDAHGC